MATTITGTTIDVGTNVIVTDSAGNVGIGTASPLNALQIGSANPITMNGDYPEIHFNGYYAAPYFRAVTTGYSTRMSFNSSNGSLSFKVGSNSTSAGANYNPIERVTLDKDGHLLVGDGITLGNGQTYAAANTLDDYEEGVANLTYVSTGSTFNYSVRKCYYTKVGRIVHISVYMQLDGSQTLSANTVHISGLPFAAANNGGQEATAICAVRYVNYRSGYNALQARISPNQSKIDLYEQGDNQPGVGLVADQLSNSSGQIFFTMSYIAA